MKPEQAVFWGVIAGGAFTLAGTLLTGLLNIFAQWRQAVFLQGAERKKQMLERRLVAIQNAVKMVDFLIAARNAHLGQEGRDYGLIFGQKILQMVHCFRQNWLRILRGLFRRFFLSIPYMSLRSRLTIAPCLSSERNAWRLSASIMDKSVLRRARH